MTKIIKPLLRELQLRNCGFNHMPPEELVRSQWQSRTKNIYYLVYRWAIAIFFIGVVADSMSNLQSAQDWGLYFIYLTHWGILLCLITGIYGAIIVSKWYFHPEYSEKIIDSNEMPVTFKIYWSVHNITLTLAISISIIYWTIIHNEKLPINSINILTHACNSVFMLLDMFIVAYPIRIYHVIQTIIIGFIYGLFTFIYHLFDGVDMFGNPYIYNVLNWKYPINSIITLIGSLILAIFIHVVLYLLYKIRVKIYRHFFTKENCFPVNTTTNPNNSSTILTMPGSRISMVFSNEIMNTINNGKEDIGQDYDKNGISNLAFESNNK